MTKSVVSRYWGLPFVGGRRYSNGAPAFPDSRSINFVESTPPTYDRATISVLPDGFGDGLPICKTECAREPLMRQWCAYIPRVKNGAR